MPSTSPGFRLRVALESPESAAPEVGEAVLRIRIQAVQVHGVQEGAEEVAVIAVRHDPALLAGGNGSQESVDTKRRYACRLKDDTS